jgi:transglutaminase-like putative cysteine protease
MRFDIRYHTKFSYEPAVFESHNELRACPVTDEHQRLVTYRVGVAPNARPLSFTDYWGTRVDAFGVRLPHRALEVVAEATVETSPRPLVESHAGFDDLGDADFVARHHEYLQATRHTDWDDHLFELATTCAHDTGPDVISVAFGIHDLVRASLRYEKGATDIGTPVIDVMKGGAGVCQDFAHLAVALCRAIGLPARYVSGYLFSADDATAERTDKPVVNVQTHAWIEVAVPDVGWFPLDPTNGREVGELHVKVGHGRDYDDVCPFRGVYNGIAEVTLEAAVEIRKGEPMLPGGLFTLMDSWSDTPSSPLRVTQGARTPVAMPALDQEQQQQQQQQ